MPLRQKHPTAPALGGGAVRGAAVALVVALLAVAALAAAAGPVWADHEPGSRCANPKPHPPGCLIKGNISRNGFIYHVPGKSRWYSRTCINKPGERWFCTERDARNAGWRAPRG